MSKELSSLEKYEKQKSVVFNDELKKDWNRLKESMNSCGNDSIGGINLDSFDPKLLSKINNDDVNEHWAIQSSAIAYYGYKKNRVSEKIDLIKRKIKEIIMKNRKKINDLLKDKYNISRPSKDDMESIAITENIDDAAILDGELLKLQSMYKDYEVWFNAWSVKGYNLKGYSETTIIEKREFTRNG